MRLVPARAALLGALFAAIVTLPGLGTGTLWDNSETAYSEVAREILLTHDWVVMHLNAQPWFVQPPLYFWIAAIFSKILGVTALAMRLPSALATIVMGGAIGYATARIAGERAGTVAAIVLSTSLMQAIVGRLAIMDALLDLAVVAAILWWFRALEPFELGGVATGKRTTAFLCGAAALALGTLAKGPVAPVVVLMVVGAWLVWERRAGTSLAVPRPATLAAAAAIYLVIVLPWFLAEGVRVGPAGAGELILHYTVGRYTGVIENQHGPWWYYLPVLILGFFPWIAFVPMAATRAASAARRAGGSLERLALVWTVLPLLFFSFAQTKLPNYVALMLPAMAILVALWFDRIAAGADRRAAVISAATIPLFVGTLGFAAEAFIRTNRLEIATGVIAPELEILAIAMLAGSLLTVIAAATPRWTAAMPYVLGATAGALVLFIANVAEPVAEGLKPIPPIARALEAARRPSSVVAVRGVSGSNALVFYSRPGVRQIGDNITEFVGLICQNPDVFLVTRADDVADLTRIVNDHGGRVSGVEAALKVRLVHIGGATCTSAGPPGAT